MADILLSSIAGGSERPPTVLTPREITGGVAIDSKSNTLFGATHTASVASATLTEVLNITGRGFITYMALVALDTNSFTVAAADIKFRVVLDGVTVTDLDGANSDLSDGSAIELIGHYDDSASGGSATEGKVPFNKTLVVSISGDASGDATVLAYKRYLT